MKQMIRAGLLLLPFCNVQTQSLLSSLASSERAFAAATRELGVRNGFLTFFADDAITFAPEPGNAKERLLKRPPTAYPLTSLLLWNPTEGDVARSGDLGYLTGPSAVMAGPRRDSIVYSGQYFSVWKRGVDGVWKVLLDAGTEVPGRNIDPDTVGFVPASSYEPLPDTTIRGTVKGLEARDAELNALYDREPSATADAFTRGIRFHVDGRAPLVGWDEAKSYLRSLTTRKQRMVAAGVSAAGDLGYSYGTFEYSGKVHSYARVWKMTNEGWRVVLEWNG